MLPEFINLLAAATKTRLPTAAVVASKVLPKQTFLPTWQHLETALYYAPVMRHQIAENFTSFPLIVADCTAVTGAACSRGANRTLRRTYLQYVLIVYRSNSRPEIRPIVLLYHQSCCFYSYLKNLHALMVCTQRCPQSFLTVWPNLP